VAGGRPVTARRGFWWQFTQWAVLAMMLAALAWCKPNQTPWDSHPMQPGKPPHEWVVTR